MAINNLNPRRVVWFSPNEPSNKYDIWLSRNAHYNENGEPTTDSNSQRDCDYIFKIYDCGKWNPIVGFNTTAANKIDIVEGNTLYHPAIFTGENPNDLYDAGTLGSLLGDPNFVTEQEWHDVFNSSNYDWGDIFGDTNWFGDLTWSIIQGGSSSYQLPRAQSNRLGGVWADTFATVAANGFAQCKFKGSSDSNLYVSGSDIIGAINAYYTSGGTTPIDIQLANTENIGGIKAAQDPNTADDCRNIPIVLAGPTVGSVWGLPFGSGTYPGDTDNETEYLYLPGWALLEWMKNPYFNQQEPQPFISGWKGVDTQLRENSDLIWVGLSGVIPENTGKFCTIQLDNTDPSGATIDWVDLPEGTRYSAGTGITISQQNEISIDTTNASTNQVLTKKANGVGWSTPSQQTQYTGVNLIKVNSSNNEIGINMDSNPSAGDIIICDGTGRDVVAKWGAVPNPNLAIINVKCGNGELTLTNNILSVRNGSFTINDESYASNSYVLNEWTYYIISDYKSLAITSMKLTANPVYMKFSPRIGISNFTCVGDVIDAQGVLTDSNFYEDAFVTLQFGIAKFEKVQSITNNP